MKPITTAHVLSSAAPSAFFAKWADLDTWPEWNADMEWIRMDGPFVQGGTGVLKPKGGPKVRFVIETLIDGEAFVDVSKLPGGRLIFDHRVRATASGTAVDVTITMRGPLGWLWKRVMGGGFRKTAQSDLEGLARAAEALGHSSVRADETATQA
jgi:hypothetical protein